jgi:hypothetical protein
MVAYGDGCRFITVKTYERYYSIEALSYYSIYDSIEAFSYYSIYDSIEALSYYSIYDAGSLRSRRTSGACLVGA